VPKQHPTTVGTIFISSLPAPIAAVYLTRHDFAAGSLRLSINCAMSSNSDFWVTFLMPEHFHLLIWPEKAGNPSEEGAVGAPSPESRVSSVSDC